MQAEHEVRPLSALAAGEAGTVRRVPDDDELLPQLSLLGLVPGRQITVKKLRPLTISIDGNDQVVPRKLADAVGVG
jgi:Fe2+ transport system protein FeoA